MSRAWMPFYVADYLADTGHLSPAEHGAYLLLMMHYWQSGSLPDDDRKLARIARMSPVEWADARDTVAEFFEPGWKHNRIEDELKTANELREKARAKANKRWHKDDAAADAAAHAAALPEQCQSQSPSQEIVETLELNPEREESDNAPLRAAKSTYAFESGVIRLNGRDLDAWRKAYVHLDLEAELLSLSEWAGWPENRVKWFVAVSGALSKRNREQKQAIERARAEGQARGHGPPAEDHRPMLSSGGTHALTHHDRSRPSARPQSRRTGIDAVAAGMAELAVLRGLVEPDRPTRMEPDSSNSKVIDADWCATDGHGTQVRRA
jgi:uncharacterized protein YdaU (DUF1376 family)